VVGNLSIYCGLLAGFMKMMGGWCIHDSGKKIAGSGEREREIRACL
jgi:hypothetical protein